MVAAVTAIVKSERCFSGLAIVKAQGSSAKSVHPILTHEMGLVKMLARLVPKAAIHADSVIQDWLDARGIKVPLHLPYSPDLVSANFFLITKLKKLLADRTLTPKTIKTT